MQRGYETRKRKNGKTSDSDNFLSQVLQWLKRYIGPNSFAPGAEAAA
jgi:hypothetical protein